MNTPAQKPVLVASNETTPESFLKKLKVWLRGKPNDNSLKEALEEVLEEHSEEGTETVSEEKEILKNVITFADREVQEIMTPRPEIKGVEYNTSLPELKAHIAANNHTRIPVYNDTLDNIKGFIHVKDLVPHLSGGAPFNMALILRELLFVPPSMRLINLLVKMRETGVHMAIVVDEYGGTDGLVTLEDLFEEIVGEISDEHDEEENDSIAWSINNSCDLDATTRIEKLDEALGLSLLPAAQEHEYETLGGLIFFTLDRVPSRGEVLPLAEGITCHILSADPRRIHRVRLTRAAAPLEKE